MIRSLDDQNLPITMLAPSEANLERLEITVRN
jgi:hypothetical protein